MTTQRIELDISSDIFDKVMFFLENLPKEKVKITFLNNAKKELNQEENIFSQIDPVEWQNEICSENETAVMLKYENWLGWFSCVILVGVPKLEFGNEINYITISIVVFS